MKPAPFTYHRPQSVPDALRLLGTLRGSAKLLAGGQSLGPMLNLRLARPGHVIDINDLVELDVVRLKAGMLEIGALTRHHRLATDARVARACPLLAEAASTIGHYAIRQRGTIGGSLSHADPAAQLPLATVLFDASIEVAAASRTRTVQGREFFVSAMNTLLADDEMVTAVRFPVMAATDGWGFEIFSQRHGDFAIVAVATLLSLARDGRIGGLRIALGGSGSAPVSVDHVVRPFLNEKPDAQSFAAIGRAVMASMALEGDKRIPDEYRRDLALVLTVRALEKAARRAQRVSMNEPLVVEENG